MTDYQDTQKQRFVRELAQYLVGNQAEMSIGLEMKSDHAQRWAKLRNTTPLSGYPTVDEAEKQLAEWLGIKLDRTDKEQETP